MSEQPIQDMKSESAKQAKDPKTRTILAALLALWLITLAALVGVGWNAYFTEKDKTQTLAQQIALACETGSFPLGFSPEDEEALCSNAEAVIEENDPELQDQEIQEVEIQESEIQDPEFQDSEIQNPENPNAEVQDGEIQNSEIQDDEVQDEETQDEEVQDEESQDPEIQDNENQDPENQEEENQDPENQDEEIQDPEIDDPEIQDPEIQDPEIDDPDPASPFVFTFVFVVPGANGSPDTTYTVTCNSGTGACTVTPS